MPTTVSRNRGMVLSEKKLREMGGLGLRYDFLRLLALRDVTPPFGSDFMIKALDTTNVWTIGASSTSTTWAKLAAAGGFLRGVTGTSIATGALQIQASDKYWTGTSYGLMACLFKVDDITDVRIECGFADVLPAVGTTVVNSLTSHTFNSVVQTASFVYDHVTSSASVTTTGLYTIGTSVAGSSVQTTTYRPSAATNYLVVVEIDEGNAFLYTGDYTEPLAVARSKISPGTGMFPYFAIKNTAGASKTVDLDFLYAWSGRLG